MSQELVPVKDILGIRSSMILSQSVEELHETVDKLDRQNKNLSEKLIFLSFIIGFLAVVQILPLFISFSRILDITR